MMGASQGVKACSRLVAIPWGGRRSPSTASTSAPLISPASTDAPAKTTVNALMPNLVCRPKIIGCDPYGTI
jgi:hypothetical protein